MLILSVLLIPVWYLVSKHEEKFLIEKFGERYLGYMKETPMFIHYKKKYKGKNQKPED